LALLAAKGSIPGDALRSTAVFGELALDGRLRSVPGVLPAALSALEAGLQHVIVPASNAAEARLVDGLDVMGVRSLRECMAMLSGTELPDEPDQPPLHEDLRGPGRRPARTDACDLADVRGQESAPCVCRGPQSRPLASPTSCQTATWRRCGSVPHG
jgi:magnesium chelatase family protein